MPVTDPSAADTPIRIVLVSADDPAPSDTVGAEATEAVLAAATDLVTAATARPVEHREGLASVVLEATLTGDLDTLRRSCAAAVPVGWDVAVVAGAVLERAGLLVLDVDSTLVTAEVIELLAEHAGTREQVADVTERAMRGELDFTESLSARVATLAGLPTTALQDVLHRVHLAPGATALIGRAREHGATIGLVSGGFTEVVTPVARLLGVTHVRANTLEVDGDRITGRVSGPVVDRAAKAATLQEWAAQLGVPTAETVAIGDGANDLDMLATAGLGIAYRAKPVVAAAADARIEIPRLDVAAEYLRW